MRHYTAWGMMASAATFALLGLLFLVVGTLYDVPSLRYQGYFWLPGGLISMALLYYLKRHDRS
ncbi:MAG: hypothetical protein JXK05_04375 [Campylobacterales bacterium]|nr:hypothetical protein [Campylobacterales bacterium]